MMLHTRYDLKWHLLMEYINMNSDHWVKCLSCEEVDKNIYVHKHCSIVVRQIIIKNCVHKNFHMYMWVLRSNIILFRPGEGNILADSLLFLKETYSLLVQGKILYLKIIILLTSIVLDISEKIRDALSKSKCTNTSYVIVFELMSHFKTQAHHFLLKDSNNWNKLKKWVFRQIKIIVDNRIIKIILIQEISITSIDYNSCVDFSLIDWLGNRQIDISRANKF